MFAKIVTFLDVECNLREINTNLNINTAAESRSKFFQNILYKDYFLKRIFKKLLTDRFAAKIKNRLSFINKKRLHDRKRFNMKNNIHEEYLIWNNEIVDKTEELTNLNLSDWYYYI